MPALSRRAFLQALTALGASWVLEADASAQAIDDLWSAAQRSPWYFEVDSSLTIIEPLASEPEVWGDVFDICTASLQSATDLIAEVRRCEPLRSYFQDLPRDALDEVLSQLAHEDLSRAERQRLRRLAKAMEDPDDGWEDCVRYEEAQETDGGDAMSTYRHEIEQWLTEPIDWFQYDGETLLGGGQGQAYRFFEDLDPGTRKALGVVLVEGEHPGSTYWAAELRGDLDAANVAAEAMALPIRFRRASLSGSHGGTRHDSTI